MIRNNNRQQTYYVCSAIKEDLISETFSASSVEEAENFFKIKFGLKPKIVLGPFLKKKIIAPKIETAIKFDGKPRQGIYNGYVVNAFSLKEPADSAFLIFIKSVDGDSKQLPKGTVIVPINDIRFS